MSLTEQAYRERKWGSFPILRQVLEDKHLPDKYFGITSASDNLFDRFHRLIEITLLTREYREELLKIGNRDFKAALHSEELLKMGYCDFKAALHNDLEGLEHGLKYMRSFIDEEIEIMKRLRNSL